MPKGGKSSKNVKKSSSSKSKSSSSNDSKNANASFASASGFAAAPVGFARGNVSFARGGFSANNTGFKSDSIAPTVDDGELQFHLLKLTKRDGVTKVKALNELTKLLKERTAKQLKLFMPVWVWYFNKLSLDNNRHVREGLYDCWEQLIGTAKKSLQPHLKTVFGNWWSHQYDISREVSTAAKKCFNLAFAEEKHAAVLSFVSTDFLTEFLPGRLKASAETLSDMNITSEVEAEERYVRTVAASYTALAGFLQQRGKDDNKSNNHELQQLIMSSPIIIKRVTDKHPAIRKSVYILLKALTLYAPTVIENELAKFAPLALGILNEQDKMNHVPMWDLLLHFAKHFPHAWPLCKARKAVFPRLFKMLSAAGYNDAQGLYPFIGTFLHFLPLSTVWNVQEGATDEDIAQDGCRESALGLYGKILQSIWEGAKIALPLSFKNKANPAASTFLETCTHILTVHVHEEAHRKEICSFVVDHVLAVMRVGLLGEAKSAKESKQANKNIQLAPLKRRDQRLLSLESAGQTFATIQSQLENLDWANNLIESMWQNLSDLSMLAYESQDGLQLLSSFIESLSKGRGGQASDKLLQIVRKLLSRANEDLQINTRADLLDFAAMCSSSFDIVVLLSTDESFEPQLEGFLTTLTLSVSNIVQNSTNLDPDASIAMFNRVIEILCHALNAYQSNHRTILCETIFSLVECPYTAMKQKSLAKRRVILIAMVTTVLEVIITNYPTLWEDSKLTPFLTTLSDEFVQCSQSMRDVDELTVYTDFFSLFLPMAHQASLGKEMVKSTQTMTLTLVTPLEKFVTLYEQVRGRSTDYCGGSRLAFLYFQLEKQTKMKRKMIPKVLDILGRHLDITPPAGKEEGKEVVGSEELTTRIVHVLFRLQYVSLTHLNSASRFQSATEFTKSEPDVVSDSDYDADEMADDELMSEIADSAHEIWQNLDINTSEYVLKMLFGLASELGEKLISFSPGQDPFAWGLKTSQLIASVPDVAAQQLLLDMILPETHIDSPLHLILKNGSSENVHQTQYIYECLSELLYVLGADVLFDRNSNCVDSKRRETRDALLLHMIATRKELDYWSHITSISNSTAALRCDTLVSNLQQSIYRYEDETPLVMLALKFARVGDTSGRGPLLVNAPYGLSLTFALSISTSLNKLFNELVFDPGMNALRQTDDQAKIDLQFVDESWMRLLRSFTAVLRDTNDGLSDEVALKCRQLVNALLSCIVIGLTSIEEGRNQYRDKLCSAVSLLLPLVCKTSPNADDDVMDQLLEPCLPALLDDLAKTVPSIAVLEFLGVVWTARPSIMTPYVMDSGLYKQLVPVVTEGLQRFMKPVTAAVTDEIRWSVRAQNVLHPKGNLVKNNLPLCRALLLLANAMLDCNKELFYEVFPPLFNLLSQGFCVVFAVEAARDELLQWSYTMQGVITAVQDEKNADNVLMLHQKLHNLLDQKEDSKQYDHLFACLTEALGGKMPSLVTVAYMLLHEVFKKFTLNAQTIIASMALREVQITHVVPKPLLLIISSQISRDQVMSHHRIPNVLATAELLKLPVAVRMQTFLLSWKLLLDVFPSMGNTSQATVTWYLQEYQCLHPFLDQVFEHIAIHATDEQDENKVRDIITTSVLSGKSETFLQDLEGLSTHNEKNAAVEEEIYDAELDFPVRIAAVCYIAALRTFPVLSRQWFTMLTQSKSIHKTRVEQVRSITQTYFSPILHAEEIAAIHAGFDGKQYADDFGNDGDYEFTVQISPVTQEIVATFELAEIHVKLAVMMAKCLPLERSAFELREQVKLNSSQGNTLRVKIERLLNYSNANVTNTIWGWHTEMVGYFDGVEECMICQFVMNAYREIPKEQCRQCKKKYHSTCLYKWFESSGKTQCPLCRALF